MKKDNMKKNIIWNTIGVFTLSLTSFVYSFVLARFCSLSITGVWSYAFALACTMATLASFGGRTFQVTDSKNELSTYTYVSSRYTSVFIVLILSIFFIIIKNFDVNKSLIIISLCAFKFFEELSDVYYGILQKHDKLYIVGKSLFFKSIINIIIFMVSILFIKKLLPAVILILINNVLFFMFYDRKSALKEEHIEKKFIKNEYIKYFKNNLMICLILFMATYLVNCPKYVMANYLSNELQGIFNILVLPATAITLIGTFIINPLLVDISKYYKNGDIKQIKKISYKIISIIFLVGVIGVMLAILIGNPIYKLVFNFNLSSYMKEFIIIIFGCIFYTITMVLTSILITTRNLFSQLICNFMLLFISYVICNIFIKKYGIIGAAYAYLITMFIRFIIYTYFVIKIKEGKNEKKQNS